MKNEERLKAILECSRLGTWEWNVQTGETRFNERWAEIVGYSLDELAPVSIKTWETLAHPDDLKASGEFLEKHFCGQVSYYDIECRMKHKDGHWVWVRDRGKIVSRTEDGQPLLMLGTHEDVSERKQAELDLRESERRLSLATKSAGFGIWDWDILSNDFFWDERMFRLYGISERPEHYGLEYWQSCLHPEDRTQTAETCMAAVRGEKIYDVEFRVQWLDGTVRWLKGDGIVIRDNDDKPVRMLGTNNDITEHKKVEKALRESEALYRGLLNNLTSGVVAHAPDTSILVGNKAAARILGLTKDQMYGKTAFDPQWKFIRKDGSVMPLEEYPVNQVLSTHAILHNLILGVKRPQLGDIAWLLVNGFPVFDEDGSIEQAIISFVDITERKQAEERLATEKERLAVTLESIGDGVITTDTSGNIVLLNNAAQEMTGWPPSEAEGRPLSEVFNIINELTRERCDNPVTQVLNSGDTVKLTNHTALLTKDNREIIIADCAAPIKTSNGETIGVVLVFRDMTEKKKLESVVEVSSKLESLGVLAGGIAHDFNNLLGGIYGNIDLALESAKDKATSQYLAKTISILDRARALTQQLLTFAKGGAPVQKIEPLFPFIQETAQFALSGSNVSCHFDIQPGIWNCNFDRNQIGQVIDNLIINAQQAMPVGGTIDLSARNIFLAEKEHPLLAKGAYVRISIKDSGVGIPRELLVKIFDPFFTTKSKGHGLGLATCYSIVNRHGGCIDVNSEPAKGSVFNVYLPAADSTTTSISKVSESRHIGSGVFLVMDDEEIIRDILRQMLESFGYRVVCKDNGKEALDFLASESETNRPVAGMIFDLTVPGGMGGMEAIAEFRKTDAKTPAFVASGYADGPVMKNPTEYGFTAGICKPFRKAELMEMLEKHMKGK